MTDHERDRWQRPELIDVKAIIADARRKLNNPPGQVLAPKTADSSADKQLPTNESDSL